MSSLIEKIEETVTPAINELGYDIVKLALNNYGKNRTLQLMIEKKSGDKITIDDCELISKEVSVLLDVLDPIKNKYILEVSSAGINRPLVKAADYIRFIGQNVLVKTYISKENNKIFIGLLEHADNDKIKIKLKEPLQNGDNFIELLYEEISNARLNNEIHINRERQ